MQRCFLDISFRAGFGIPGTAVAQGPNKFLHVSVYCMFLCVCVCVFVCVCYAASVCV